MNLKQLHEFTGRLLATGFAEDLPVVASSDVAEVVLGRREGRVLGGDPSDIIGSQEYEVPREVYGVSVGARQFETYDGPVASPRQIDMAPVMKTAEAVVLVTASRLDRRPGRSDPPDSEPEEGAGS